MPKKEKIASALETGAVKLEDADATATKREPQREQEPKVEMLQISPEEWKKMQDQIKLLTAVADKSRIESYQQREVTKPILKVKLSVVDGKYLVGWDVVKDINIYQPTTGKQIGEEQIVDIILLGSDGELEKKTVSGYKQFSDVRHEQRVECDVVSKKEDNVSQKTIFEVALPDGRKVELDAKFVN